MSIFKRTDWFALYQFNKVEYDEIKKDKQKYLLDKNILRKIKRFFFWKFKKVNYFEPYTNSNGITFVILGTAKNVGTRKITVNRNVLIFILELYAYIQNSQKKVTIDFPKNIITLKDKKIEIYKVKNF
jgi:hypothetical protein